MDISCGILGRLEVEMELVFWWRRSWQIKLQRLSIRVIALCLLSRW